MAPIGQVLGCDVFSKTKMCKFHRSGKCAKGKQCPWAHDASELKDAPDLRRTKICKELFSTGQCTNANCTFAHSKEEWRTIAHIANGASYKAQTNVSTPPVAVAKNLASKGNKVEQTSAMYLPVSGAEAPGQMPMSFSAGMPAFVPLPFPPPGLKDYVSYSSPSCEYPSFVREASVSDCSTTDDIQIDGNTSIAQILALSMSAK